MRPASRCALLLVADVLLTGCQSAPPVEVSPPTAGDSLQQIVQRGHVVVPVYTFSEAGREYSFGNAYAEHLGYDLILIDGRLACAHREALEDLTAWEWVSEPGGLTYLASRLRQACGLEPPTAPRDWPPQGRAPAFPAPSATSEPSATERALRSTLDNPVVQVVGGSLAYSVWLVYGPVIILGSAAADATAKALANQASVSGFHKMTSRTLQIGLSRDDLESRVGRPDVEFGLPLVDTSVLGYDLQQSRPYFVGLNGDRVIWLHEHYPWLLEQAEFAKRTAKRRQE